MDVRKSAGRIAPGERTGRYPTGDDGLPVNDQGESSISMEDYPVALVDEDRLDC